VDGALGAPYVSLFARVACGSAAPWDGSLRDIIGRPTAANVIGALGAPYV
jgi:hypothetical protein